MQKLKRLPFTKRLESTLGSLLRRGRNLLGELPLSGKPGLIALMLLTVLILAMCSGCSPRMVKPELPPQADARDMPPYDGQTMRDAILYLIEVREWGMACESDKSVIRHVWEAQ